MGTSTIAKANHRRPPTWLSRQEAAAEYGVSTKTISRRIEDGSLPAYRVGGRIRVKGSDLDQLARRIPSAATR